LAWVRRSEALILRSEASGRPRAPPACTGASFETPLAAASQDGAVSESADRWTTFGPDILHVITGLVPVIPIW
jgi:hypothetical protein